MHYPISGQSLAVLELDVQRDIKRRLDMNHKADYCK